MIFEKWDGSKSEQLLNCPFCGDEPTVEHMGNSLTKKRSIIVKCKGCRCTQKNSAMLYGFSWLEDLVVKKWNSRAI